MIRSKESLNMNGFSHFNEEVARMVDISDKSSTVRTAAAISSVHMKHDVYSRIKTARSEKETCWLSHRWQELYAKQTSAIIPMCHPLSLSSVDISFGWEEKDSEAVLHIQASVKRKGVQVWKWKR